MLISEVLEGYRVVEASVEARVGNAVEGESGNDGAEDPLVSKSSAGSEGFVLRGDGVDMEDMKGVLFV